MKLQPKTYKNTQVLVIILLIFQVPSCNMIDESEPNDLQTPLKAAEAATAPNPINKPGYVLDRNDEFDGTTLNTSLWIPSYLSYRTTEERAAARYELRDGNLVLRIDDDQLTYYPDNAMKVSSFQTGQRDYLHKDNINHSTPTIMKYTPQYGYFEIRAKLVNQTGYHCAFWTTGVRDEPWQEGEIDIMEQYGGSRSNNFNLFKWDDPNLATSTYGMTLPFDPSGEYHIYALEWDPNSIKFYVDNQLYRTVNQSPNYPAVFYLSIYENAGWTGTADTSPHLYPREFIIDYFRAYKKEAVISSSIEAEDMILDNYSVENNADASNGALIRTDGTGTASATYDGTAITTDIKVSYFDETDGVSSYKLYKNTTLIDQWTADQDLGSDAPVSATLTSRIVPDITLADGDVIKIEGTVDNFEYARVDKIELQSGITNSVEAENMTLTNYSVESNADASNGALIRTSGTGTATTTYNGPATTKSIKVSYFDETDGISSYKLYKNSTLIGEWTANQDLGSAAPESITLTSQTFADVTLNDGDIIKIEGTADNFEYARVDKIELQSGIANSVEAENMTLTNYSVESNADASNGALIRTSGTGTATTTYEGSTTTANIKISYFDETDGISSYKLYKNSTLIGEWAANQNLGSAAPESITLTSQTFADVTLNDGDIIKIEGTADNFEYARVDRIEFINPL